MGKRNLPFCAFHTNSACSYHPTQSTRSKKIGREMNKKHGFCQYPGCNLDLGFVQIAKKYCLSHKIAQIKQTQQAAHRQNYKSKFHREKTISKKWSKPRALPSGLKEGAPCPGNGNGYCGGMLRRERAFDSKGFSTSFFDFFCGTHRFPDPREEK